MINAGNRKRQSTDKIKTWDSRYRAELFKSHLEDQHSSHWVSLSAADKRSFFENKIQFKDTLHRSLGAAEPSIYFKIDINIMKELIGDMFFHPDNHDDIIQERVLKLFTLDNNEYIITIKHPAQFFYVLNLIADDLSFRQVQK